MVHSGGMPEAESIATNEDKPRTFIEISGRDFLLQLLYEKIRPETFVGHFATVSVPRTTP